ncbi:MAG: hypothetical protein QOG85_73 [Gaiellaceae bacterium]|jgi:hypothetical protein|nr:hypothetical protein [Gaiellaceae bacterium]
MDPASILALLGLIQLVMRIFGPPVARFMQAEVESFRARNPDHPNAIAAVETISSIFEAAAHEFEHMDWGTMTPDEIGKAKRDGVIVEASGRVAARGLQISPDDAAMYAHRAYQAVVFLAGGRKAPAVPIADAAIQGGA